MEPKREGRGMTEKTSEMWVGWVKLGEKYIWGEDHSLQLSDVDAST
jgi:hypothetical protein